MRHLLIIALASAPFLPFLNNPLAWDDRHYLTDNTFTHDLRNVRELVSPTYFDLYPERPGWRPLLVLSFMADHALWGLSPGPRRVPNLLVHLANSGLVYHLATALTARPDAALAVGLIFALHPVHSENVFCSYFRTDSVATLFVLLGLLAYRRWPADRPFLRTGAAWATMTAFVAGIGFKEGAAVLLPLLWIHDRLRLHPDPAVRGRWNRYAPFAAFVVAYGLFRAVFLPPQTTTEPTLASTWGGEIMVNLLTFPKALVTYARLALWPYPLAVDHAIAPARAVEPAVLAGLAIMTGYLWLLRRAWRVAPVAALGLAWAGLAHLPSAHLLPGVVTSFVAERYAYNASVGVALAVAAGLARRPAGALSAWGPILLGLSVLYAGIDVRRGAEWRVPLTLYEKTMALYPNSYRALYNRAFQLEKQGRRAEAQDTYERAIAADATWPEAHTNLGNILMDRGDFDGARRHFHQARLLEPENAGLYLNLGNVEFLTGQLGLAESWYREALKRRPDFPDAVYMLEQTAKRRAAAPSAYGRGRPAGAGTPPPAVTSGSLSRTPPGRPARAPATRAATPGPIPGSP